MLIFYDLALRYSSIGCPLSCTRIHISRPPGSRRGQSRRPWRLCQTGSADVSKVRVHRSDDPGRDQVDTFMDDALSQVLDHVNSWHRVLRPSSHARKWLILGRGGEARHHSRVKRRLWCASGWLLEHPKVWERGCTSVHFAIVSTLPVLFQHEGQDLRLELRVLKRSHVLLHGR